MRPPRASGSGGWWVGTQIQKETGGEDREKLYFASFVVFVLRNAVIAGTKRMLQVRYRGAVNHDQNYFSPQTIPAVYGDCLREK